MYHGLSSDNFDFPIRNTKQAFALCIQVCWQRFCKTVPVVKDLNKKRRRAHIALTPIMSDYSVLISQNVPFCTIFRSLLFQLPIVFSAFQPYQNSLVLRLHRKIGLGNEASPAKYYRNACSAIFIAKRRTKSCSLHDLPQSIPHVAVDVYAISFQIAYMHILQNDERCRRTSLPNTLMHNPTSFINFGNPTETATVQI